MTERDIDALRAAVADHTTPARYRHTLGVEKEIRFLAASLAPDLLLEAAAAALLHDVTKRLTFEEQLAYCAEHGLAVTDDERLSPALLHAKTGAHFARTPFPAVTTDAIMDAIARHTTGEMPLSLLAAMLFLADFTEEGRDHPPFVAMRKTLRSQPLTGDAGMALFKRTLLDACNHSIMGLIERGRPIALRTVEARNAFLTNQFLF